MFDQLLNSLTPELLADMTAAAAAVHYTTRPPPYPGAFGTRSKRRRSRNSFGTLVRPAGSKLARKAREGKL